MRSIALAFAILTGGLAAQGQVFGPMRTIVGSKVFTGSAAAFDVNLDGTKDLVLGNAFPLDLKRTPGIAYCLDSSLRFLAEEDIPVSTEPGLISYPANIAGDFNGDGLVDFVSVSTVGSITIHRHQGVRKDAIWKSRFLTPKSYHRLQILGSNAVPDPFVSFTCTGLAVNDYDGDGKLDLAISGIAVLFFSNVATAGVTIIPGDGKGGLGTERRVLDGRLHGFAETDLELDGRPDLVGLADDGTLRIGHNKGALSFTKSTFRLTSPRKRNRFAVFDYDGDGRKDYAVGGIENARAALSIYLASKNGLPGTVVHFPLAVTKDSRIEEILYEDLDADGHSDFAILFSRTYNAAYIYFQRGLGKGKFQKPVLYALGGQIATNEMSGTVRFLQAVDLDGDRNKELIVASIKDAKGEKTVAYVFPNQSPQKVGTRYRGIATPGSFKRKPVLSAQGGAPVLGNRKFRLMVTEVPGGGSLGALIFASHFRPMTVAGVTWNLFPTFAIGFFTRGKTEEGIADIPLAVPVDPQLPFYDYHFQALVRDASAPNPLHIGATRALSIRFSAR